MRRPTRRQFCEEAALGIAALAALSARGCRPRASSGGAAPAASSAAPTEPAPKTLSAAAFATLSAVCERILPRDQDPGAVDLGVPIYVDAMIATPELAPVREMLHAVLPILDKEAGKRSSGKAFHEAAPAEQDAILETWQHGSESRARFFDVILSLTLEGAFGDPKYGGNLGGRGFTVIGFTPDAPIKKGAPMPSMPSMNHAGASDG